MSRATAASLAIVPAFALLVGTALSYSSQSGAMTPGWPVLGPVMAAGLAPVLTAVLLPLLAPGFDRVLLASAAMLTTIGTAALVNVSSSATSGDEFYASIVARHGSFVAGGFAFLLLGAVAARHLDRVRAYPLTLLALSLALTTATILRGEVVNGARLWLSVGPLRFQPSEIGRLLLALFVAVYLYERRHLVSSAWRVRSIDLPPAPYLIPLAAAILSAIAVLALQNDLGMAALIALGVAASVIGVGRSRLLSMTAAAFLVTAGIGSYVAVPRVRDRVAGWLDPWADPAGRGFQFVQSEYVFAAGSLAGGATGSPTRNVPEVHTDLILNAVGGHFGLLGSLGALAISGLLVCRCVLVGLRTRDGFRAMVAFTIAALLGVQIVLIVGGTTRVLPLTGLTFPLLSYGGTSMIVSLFAVGIELGIGTRGGAVQVRRSPMLGSMSAIGGVRSTSLH